jgi:hypothetical protein
MIKASILFAVILLLAGCSTGGRSRAVNIHGVDAAEMRNHWREMLPLMAGDLETDGKGLEITVANSEATGTNTGGPYTCNDEGCWHGINYMRGKTHKIFYPAGSETWVKRHELMHSILYVQGITGHPEWVTLRDGRRVRPKDIIRGRWPALIFQYPLALLPGGAKPLDPFKNQWKGLVCGVTDERP